MLRSMTGFGRADGEADGVRYVVEIRSVNNRHLKTVIKLPDESFCTGCGYCRDCPNGFDPTKLMQAMRDHGIYGSGTPLSEWLRDKYIGQDPGEILDLCIECGWCEEQCPQHLEIIQQIRQAKAAFAAGTPQ